MSNVVKRQHYVPQFYLRQFASEVKGDNYFIKHYDKIRRVYDRASVVSVAKKHKYYDVTPEHLKARGVVVPEDYNPQELEQMFSSLESHWAIIFKNITERQDQMERYDEDQINQLLLDEEKRAIGEFIALQAIRTPSFRNNMELLLENFNDAITQSLGINLKQNLGELDAYYFYQYISTGVIERLGEFFLANFDWFLCYSPVKLYTSDNPLARIFHLQKATQMKEGEWPEPPYFEEYSIALNPNLLLILCQQDRSIFEPDLMPTSSGLLHPLLHRRYARFHVVNAERNIFYYDKQEEKHLKAILGRMNQIGQDITTRPFLVSVPD